MVTQGANVRRGVVVFSSIFVTVQFFAIAGTVAFYFVASTPNKYRDPVTKAILRSLYQDRDHPTRSNAIIKHLRRSHGLETHILIAGAIELVFLLPSVILLIGASRRVRYLLLPWLIMFGLLQIALLCSILLAVLQLPQEFKLLSVAIAAFEAFVVFPWWFSVIHLFAVLTNEEADLEVHRSMTLKRHRQSPYFDPYFDSLIGASSSLNTRTSYY